MRKILLAAALSLFSMAAFAAQVPLLTGATTADPSQVQATINGVIGSINSTITTQSMAAPSYPRNLLDNGDFYVNQRGTTASTCGTTTIPVTAYNPDRWGCNVNVGSGAGQLATVTATPTPYQGFTNAFTFVRNSGSLAQPQCVMQEVESRRAIQAAGQTVDFSIYLYALAGMIADNAGAANLYIFTGTTADQGLGSFTASPAITPAWAGIATLGTTSVTLSAAWNRYQTGPVAIGSGVKEIAAAICWTPTVGASGGSTDGLAGDGAQLEILGAGATTASAFEFQDPLFELGRAQRFAYGILEPASGVAVGMNGTLLTTTTCALNLNLPVTMWKAPVFSVVGTALSNATFQIVVAADTSTLATTYLVSPTAANTANAVALVGTLTTSSTAGWACQLQGKAAGGGILLWSADF